MCVFFLENLINWQKRHVRFFRLSVKIVGSDGCVFLDSLAAEGIMGNDSISLNCSQNISRLINQNSLHSWVLHRHSRGHEPHVEDLWSRGLFVFVFSAQTCYSHLGVFSLLSSSRSRFSGSSGPDRADRCPTPTLRLLRHRFWRLPSLQFWTRGQRGSSDKVLHPWPILQWLCHHCHGQSHHTERWSSVRHHWCSSEGHSCRISPKKKEKKCRRREKDLNIYTCILLVMFSGGSLGCSSVRGGGWISAGGPLLHWSGNLGRNSGSRFLQDGWPDRALGQVHSDSAGIRGEKSESQVCEVKFVFKPKVKNCTVLNH